MQIIRLNRHIISKLPAPTDEQPTYYWDESLPDFGVVVHPNGRKFFLMRLSENAKQLEQIIGPCELLDFKEVRSLAKQYLANRIILPSLKASSSTAEVLGPAPYQDISFSDFCNLYIERHAKPHKHSWKLDETRIKKYLLPAWGTEQLARITRSMVAALHLEIGSSFPYQANRVREQLSAMFELAKVWDLLPESHPNPTRGIKDFREHRRKRWLKPHELENLIRALRAEPSVHLRALFTLYLLTGARKSELMRLRWQEVDLRSGYITLLMTKNGQSHELPLSKPALLLLHLIPRVPGNEYVFPGKNKGRPFVNIDKPWKRIRKRAMLQDVHIHDLRHTVGARLAQDGNSLLLIGRILNHQSLDATRVYAHLSDSSIKTALEKHGEQIMPLLSNLLVQENRSGYSA